MKGLTLPLRSALRSEASASWNETTRWSMRSLAELGGKPAASNAKVLLRDVALRLAGQHDMCSRLMDDVSNMLEYRRNDTSSSASNTKVIRAVNQPVQVSMKTLMQQRANLEQECDKAQRQLHNLRVLHSDTHKLTRGLLDNENLLQRFSAADQHVVAATMEQVRSRHATTVETMADICIGLEQVSRENQNGPSSHLHHNFLPVVETFLEGRLGVQLLCDHYVALNKGKPSGGVSVDCSLHDVVDDAVTEAKHMCDANLNTAPEVLMPELDQRITLIRPWVHHALVEVLKNAMVSSVERVTQDGGSDCTSPFIHIRLRPEKHHLCLDVIDQGVGLNGGKNAIQRAFGFAQSSARQRWDRLDEQQSYAMVRSPLQSLGVGLPLSRMMMRHFGGDVTLENRPTRAEELKSGSMAVVKLHTDDAVLECLPNELTLVNEEFQEDAATIG